MDKRVGLAVEEEAAAKVATLLLRASENAAPADSDSEDGDGADAAPQRRHPQSRRRTSAPVGVEGGYGTIAGGPQRPSRPLKAEQGAYPVGALTEQLLRDEEVARILKHLEKKGFHDDDTDMGPGGAGVRHAPDPKMRLNVHLVGTRRLPGGIGYIADEGPTPKVTAPSRDCFSPEPVDGEDCAPAGSYHPPSHARGALRMLASPRSSSDEGQDEQEDGMPPFLARSHLEMTPHEKRVADVMPGGSFLLKYMMVPLLVLFAGPLLVVNSGLVGSRNDIDVAALCRGDPNLPCAGLQDAMPISPDGVLEGENGLEPWKTPRLGPSVGSAGRVSDSGVSGAGALGGGWRKQGQLTAHAVMSRPRRAHAVMAERSALFHQHIRAFPSAPE